MAADAILFDLDGTLADTHPWYAEALAACCREDVQALGYRIREGEPAIGLARRLGVEQAFLKNCRVNGGLLPLYEGVREGLGELHDGGMPLGLVTSLSPAVTREVLEGSALKRYFAVVVAAERGLQRKPHPAPVLTALARMGLHPSRSIYYVGDHRNDEQSAHAAGISFAWAHFGYRHAAPAAPDVVLERFADVLGL